MGVLYSVIPISFAPRDEMARFLSEHALDYPPYADQSRNPTLSEIEAAASSLQGFECEYNSSKTGVWTQINVFRRAPPGSEFTYEEYSSLNVTDDPPDKATPVSIYFSKGTPRLNYNFLEAIAHVCGPLLCLADGEADAVIFHRRVGGDACTPDYSPLYFSDLDEEVS